MTALSCSCSDVSVAGAVVVSKKLLLFIVQRQKWQDAVKAHFPEQSELLGKQKMQTSYNSPQSINYMKKRMAVATLTLPI